MANGFGVYAGVGLKEKRVPIAIGTKLTLGVPQKTLVVIEIRGLFLVDIPGYL